MKEKSEIDGDDQLWTINAAPVGCLFQNKVMFLLNIRDFKIQRRGRQRERQKTIGLISKTTTSHVHHAFLYISFLFLHDYDVKRPNFAFYGGRKQATTVFFSLSELGFGPLKFSLRRLGLHLKK